MCCSAGQEGDDSSDLHAISLALAYEAGFFSVYRPFSLGHSHLMETTDALWKAGEKALFGGQAVLYLNYAWRVST